MTQLKLKVRLAQHLDMPAVTNFSWAMFSAQKAREMAWSPGKQFMMTGLMLVRMATWRRAVAVCPRARPRAIQTRCATAQRKLSAPTHDERWRAHAIMAVDERLRSAYLQHHDRFLCGVQSPAGRARRQQGCARDCTTRALSRCMQRAAREHPHPHHRHRHQLTGALRTHALGSAAFVRFDDANYSSSDKAALMASKGIFVLMNMLAMTGALYKMNSMGLLPNTPSDWIAYLQVPPNLQMSSGS